MKIKRLFLFMAAGTALTFTSCSKKEVNADEAAKRIAANENPTMMVSLKVKDMLDKGGISNKENVPMALQLLFNDQVEYVTNPEKVGLDLSGKSYIGLSVKGEQRFGWVITKIKDKETFEKTLKSEGKNKFEEIEGYNTLSEDKKFVLGWNDKLLVMAIATDGKAKEKFKSYITMIGEDKEASANYNKFFESNTDLAFHTDMGTASEMQGAMAGHNMEGDEKAQEVAKKMAEKLKGSYGVMTINFENDKIVADVANYFTESAKKEFSFLSETGFPKELLAHLGSEQLTGFISVNGNPKKLSDWVMSMSGEQNLMGELKQNTGMDVDRILSSLKGNMFMAFQGFVKTPYQSYDMDGNEITDTMNSPRMSMLVSLNDTYLETVVDSVLKKDKVENYYMLQKGNNPQYLAFKPGVLFYTNDKNTISSTTSPQFSGQAAEVLAKPLAFYFDLNALVSQMDSDETVQKIAAKLKFAAGGMNMAGGHAELILNNGGKNSLWTLINLGVESGMGAMPEM